MAEGEKTAVPPSIISPVGLSDNTADQNIGTLPRLRQLRRDCLLRDENRCVVTKWIDRRKLTNHPKKNSGLDVDNAGFELTYILPHSLMTTDQYMWHIFNSFSLGTSTLLENTNIDHPRNAFILQESLHKSFEALQLYFEEIPVSSMPPPPPTALNCERQTDTVTSRASPTPTTFAKPSAS